MKRLLLLFILSPVILFGQTRRKAIVDSIKAAATNLQDVSALVSKYPDTKMEQTQVSDSGEYVTIVIRVHVIDAGVITALPLPPVAKMKTGDIVIAGVGTVTVPPLPPAVIQAYEITALTPLAIAQLKTEDIPVAQMHVVTVPPLPDIKPELIDPLPVIVITPFKISNVAAGKMDTVAVPPLPNIEVIEALPLPGQVILVIEHVPAGKIDTTAVPDFEEKKMQVTEMHLSADGYSLLEKMEGFSPELYSLKDGGFTIGFGFFVPYGEGRKWDKGVTIEAAEVLIRQKVPAYEDQVKQYVNVLLTQEEFDALTMMAYNLGGFSKATSIVNDINSNADFEQLQKDWMRFVHSKAPGVMKGLMNRRKDELHVRNEADYQPERKIQILKNTK